MFIPQMGDEKVIYITLFEKDRKKKYLMSQLQNYPKNPVFHHT
jgi:hypothetical protein